MHRIAFDASALIYFLERNPRWYSRVAPYVEQCLELEYEGIGSTLLLTEILTGVRKRRAHRIEALVHDFFAESPGIRLIPADEAIADHAATLRAKYGLRTPDAIHLATALEAGAKTFVTADRKLGKVRGITIEVLGLKRR